MTLIYEFDLDIPKTYLHAKQKLSVVKVSLMLQHYRQTDRQTERQTDRETDGQTDRRPDGQTDSTENITTPP